MVKVRTGLRTGPRFIRRPDKARLHGAAFCAASMISKALSHRDWTPYTPALDESHRGRIERLNMRLASLWARVFAGQIDAHDPRLDAMQAQVSAIFHQAYFTNAA